MSVRHQRITIFQEDDVTPILGSVDGGGLVTVPTCSTDPASTRPYLIRALELVPSEVDFLEGSSSIGQMNVQILDKRTDPSDQATGWFTAILADVNGRQQLTGHRVLFEQQDENGDYYQVLDGVIGDFDLEGDYVTYNLTLRDIRDRERKMRLFSYNPFGVSILPRAFAYDYGQLPGVGRYLKYGTTGYLAKVHVEPGTGGKVAIAVLEDYQARRDRDYWNTYAELMRYKTNLDVASYSDDYNTWADTLRTSNIRVQWRYNSGDPWNNLIDMPYIRGSQWSMGSAFMATISITNGVYRANSKQTSTGIRLTSDNAAEIPNDASTISLRVLINGEPTEDNPLYLEMSFGQLLKNIYDGVYSPPGTLPIRYNEAVMADLVTNTPLARVKITEPVDDAREWTEQNIYKPLGMVPFINNEGKITPIKYTLPGVEATLYQLDDSNIVSGEWRHPGSNIVNRVEFTYYRDTLVLIDIDRPRVDDNTEFYERETLITFINESIELHGEHILEYDAPTVRAIADATITAIDPGEISDELGYQLAKLRAKEAFERFANGAQELELVCQRSDVGVAALNPGDWVIVASSWMPDFISKERGINRIFQIKSTNDIDPITRSFALVDGGRALAVLGVPTISSVTFDTVEKRIEVNVTVVGGTFARVDYAVSDSEPSANSGKWTYGGRINATGTVTIPNVQLGKVVWVRARSEFDNRRPSAWTSAVSYSLVGNASILNADVALLDGSDPLVRWQANADTLGVRVQYAVYGKDADIPTSLTTFGDFDVADLEGTLAGIRVPQYSRLLVSIEGYTGWTGSAVSGVAGGAFRMISERVSESYIPPDVVVTKSQTSTLGTANVTVLYDPQVRVTGLRYRTRVGTDGAWSGWTTDYVLPFEGTVALEVTQTSAIEYEVLAIDQDGTEQSITTDVVDFQGPSTVALIGEIDTIDSSDPIRVRIKVANPFPNGQDVVISFTKSVNIASVTPVTTFTINQSVVTSSLATTGYIDVDISRPIVGDGIGRVSFVGTSNGREIYTDAVDVADVSINFTGSAGDLTGTTLAPNVVNSSLTSVGTLASLDVAGAADIGGALSAGTLLLDTALAIAEGGTGLDGTAYSGVTGQRFVIYDDGGTYLLASAGVAFQALLSGGPGGDLFWGNPTPSAHELASTTGLGAEHTVSGLTAGMVLQATSATAARFQALANLSAGIILADAPFPGANYEFSDTITAVSVTATEDVVTPLIGTTTAVDTVVRANGLTRLTLHSAGGATFAAGTVAMGTLTLTNPLTTSNGGTGLGSAAYSGVTGQRFMIYDDGGTFLVASAGSANQALLSGGAGGDLFWGNPAPGAHVLATTTALGPEHTVSGLTIGMVLQATGATTARFQALSNISAGAIVADAAFPGVDYEFSDTVQAVSFIARVSTIQDGIIIDGRVGGTGSHRVTIVPGILSASRVLTLADGDTTLVAGTMVPTTGTGATGTWGINISGTAPAGTLTGAILAANVVTTSITTIGTLVGGTVPAARVSAGTFQSGAFVFAGAVSGITTLTATTLAGTLSTATQNSVTTMTGLTTIGTLVAGTVPAARISAGTFQSGAFVFAGGVSGITTLAITGAFTGATSIGLTGTVAAAGAIRLANNTSISWRNAANSADISLMLNASNQFVLSNALPVASGGTGLDATGYTGIVGQRIMIYDDGGTMLAASSGTLNQALLSGGASGDLFWGNPTPSAHVLATTTALGPEHTVSGLTIGMVLRATGATTARFEALGNIGSSTIVDDGPFPGVDYEFSDTVQAVSFIARVTGIQDGVIIDGRAGGTGSYRVSIVPGVLSASWALTLADGNTTLVAGTMVPTTGTGATGTWGINISGTAPAGTLTGATLAAGVTASSLTSVGTLTALAVTGTITANNNILFPSVGSAIAAGTRAYGPNNSSASLTANVLTGGSHLFTVNGVTALTVTASAVTATTFVGALTGSATSAATWTTARTLTIGSTGKSVNGSANVSWSLGEIGAAATSHVHSGADITSGTVDDARLSANVPLLNAANDFTNTIRFLGYVPTDMDTHNTSASRQFAPFATGFQPTNRPASANYFTGFSLRHNLGGTYVTQFAFGASDTDAFSYRYYNNTSWSVWRTVLSSQNYNSYAPTLTGTGASGTWGISITGSSASTTGNAATATALQTGRTLWGNSFNGTANIGGDIQLQQSLGTTLGRLYGTSWHDMVALSNNVYYDGADDSLAVANYRYIRAAGVNNLAGALLAIKGNGNESGVVLRFATFPTSTGADAIPASMTTRFQVTGDGSGYFANTLTINTGGIVITGNSTITGTLGGITTLTTSSTINSQTISSAASFTGTVAVATAISVGTTVAAAGNIRLPNNTTIAWRNVSNTGDITLTVNASNQFITNTAIPTSSGGTGSDASVYSGIVGQRIMIYDDGGTIQPASSGSMNQALLSGGASGDLFWGNPAPSAHVLATTTALGPEHTVSGLTAGMVLRATGATTARFEALGNIGASTITADGPFPGASYSFTDTVTAVSFVATEDVVTPLIGTTTAVDTVIRANNLTRLTLLSAGGATFAAGTITFAGGVTGITTLAIGGALTGATTIAASTSVTTPLLTNAGTLALSATGANSVTVATNGTTRLTVSSAGAWTFVSAAVTGITTLAIGGALTGATTIAASTSVTTPLVTNAGTLALSATGANTVTIATNGTTRLTVSSAGAWTFVSAALSGITTLAMTGALSGATTGAFSTSVTTPLITNAGALNLRTTGLNALTLGTDSTTRITIGTAGTVTFTGAVTGITTLATSNTITVSAGGLAITGASTFNTAVTFADVELIRPVLRDYGETTSVVTYSATPTFNINNANVFRMTLTGNITSMTISNPSASGVACTIVLFLTQDATGGRTVTSWPASVRWGAAGVPTLSGANRVDIIFLTTVDGGTSWYGSYSLNYT